MTTYPITTRRLILAGGFALAIAIAPAAAIVAHPTHSTISPWPHAIPVRKRTYSRLPARRSWCPTRRKDSRRPRPTRTSRKSTASRAPADAVQARASVWPRMRRTQARSRYRARPSAPAHNRRPIRNLKGRILRELVECMQISFSFHRILPTTRSITTESVTMATLELSVRRLILAGGFAVAVAAAPAIAVFTVPSPRCRWPSARAAKRKTCTPGSASPTPCRTRVLRRSAASPETPDLPAVGGIPCTGHNSGECIGLAEEAEAMGPQPVPRSTVSSQPVTDGADRGDTRGRLELSYAREI